MNIIRYIALSLCLAGIALAWAAFLRVTESATLIRERFSTVFAWLFAELRFQPVNTSNLISYQGESSAGSNHKALEVALTNDPFRSRNYAY